MAFLLGWKALVAGIPALLFAVSCSTVQSSIDTFGNPQRVEIEGYTQDAMEPFLSRDGRYLFFNNLNQAPVDTNLYWAERIDDLHYKFLGEVKGVNTPALDAVASMDRDGNFFFVSTRSYSHTASTLYQGDFDRGQVVNVRLVPGVSVMKPGIVNFDAEISADGGTLYFVESQFKGGGPSTARILQANKTASGFVRAGTDLLRTINSAGLDYAPATNASETEIFFTRALPGQLPAIYMAARADRTSPFGEAVRVAAIQGFAEAPTVAPDGRSVYFHLKENGRFVIYRVTRPASP